MALPAYHSASIDMTGQCQNAPHETGLKDAVFEEDPKQAILEPGCPISADTSPTFSSEFGGDPMSNLADDELILRLLSRCLPMREAAVATQALWDRYASYGNAISAPFLELLDVPSLGRPGATLLKCIHSAAIRLAAVPIRDAPLLKNLTNLYNYLNVSMARDRTEVYRVLFLDTKNYLIADEVLAEGVENWVHVSIKETARRCLQHHASAIILVHNHPSGDPTPSESDLSMTKKIQIAMEMLGIFVHDHIIIGQGTICSMRELNFFEIY